MRFNLIFCMAMIPFLGVVLAVGPAYNGLVGAGLLGVFFVSYQSSTAEYDIGFGWMMPIKAMKKGGALPDRVPRCPGGGLLRLASAFSASRTGCFGGTSPVSGR